MDLNLYLIIVSVAIGLIAALTAFVVAERFRLPLLAAAGAGAALSFVALIVMFLATGINFFAVTHLIHTITTIGIPIACATILVRGGIPKPSRVLLVVGLLPAPLGLYATHVEPFWLRVDRVELAAPTSAGFTIGVLSDLQTTSIGDYESNVVDRLIGQQPDIVVIPGDFWQMSDAQFEQRLPEFAEVMQRLDAAIPHVVAVNGNSDTVDGLNRLTTDTDVLVLDNDIVDLTVNGAAVRILGITLFGNEAEIDAAVSQFGSEVNSDAVQIVLAHQPDEIDRLAGLSNVDLLIAGHTHGGQISIPFFGPPVTLSSVPRSVAAGGLHELDGIPVYVSTGVGRERGSAPQVRFGVRPSIGVIEVVPNSS